MKLNRKKIDEEEGWFGKEGTLKMIRTWKDFF